jgi:hypothetical protein
MKTLLIQLRTFFSQYPFKYWVFLTLFLSASITSYYFLGLNDFLIKLNGIPELLGFVVLYGVHFLVPLCIWSAFNKTFNWHLKISFWFLLLAGVVIFSLIYVFPYYDEVIEFFAPDGKIKLSILIYKDLVRYGFVFICLFMIWLFTSDKNDSFYGFSFSNIKISLYLQMLLIMIPIVVLISFSDDFLKYYPRAKKLELFNPTYMDYFIFELNYGSAFIVTELFFRGFMIMAFAKYIGTQVIIPVAAFYMSIHFGKPLAETISSFFGGALLGFMAYQTKNIWGGILVHLGIAWLMELTAAIGN